MGCYLECGPYKIALGLASMHSNVTYLDTESRLGPHPPVFSILGVVPQSFVRVFSKCAFIADPVTCYISTPSSFDARLCRIEKLR